MSKPDAFTSYDSCRNCRLPRFMHDDFTENIRSTAAICRECSEFVPDPDGWVFVTRLVISLNGAPALPRTPHDLPEEVMEA